MGWWLFIIFVFVFAGLFEVAKKADDDDYKSGKQKKIKGSSGPYRWTEDGDNVKAVMWFFIIVFILGVILLGGLML